jgi:hypothetical protein
VKVRSFSASAFSFTAQANCSSRTQRKHSEYDQNASCRCGEVLTAVDAGNVR